MWANSKGSRVCMYKGGRRIAENRDVVHKMFFAPHRRPIGVQTKQKVQVEIICLFLIFVWSIDNKKKYLLFLKPSPASGELLRNLLRRPFVF